MATSTSTSTAKKATEDTIENGAPFTEQTVSAAHAAIDRLSERVARTEERLRDAATQGQGQWAEKQDEVRAQFEESIEGAREYTRENPMMAAGIAFGAGLIIANLLRR